MKDRFDCELLAIEADIHAETAARFSVAQSWRDIAQGYRMLADFVAEAQSAQHHPERHDASGKKRGRLRIGS